MLASLTSQSETTSTSTLRVNASRLTPPYQPQPMIPTLARGFDSAANSREPVATTAPAAAREETKVRLFMGCFTTAPLTLNLGFGRAPQSPKGEIKCLKKRGRKLNTTSPTCLWG